MDKKTVRKLDFTGSEIYAGIDVHLKNWKVTFMSSGVVQKTISQPPSASDLYSYLTSHYPGGSYYTAYEAGFCGFSVHRELERLGIINLVVNPADIPVTDKEKKQKEDKRDSRKIARSLHNGDLEGIYVPGPEMEEFRTYVRYRRTLVKEINRHKARIKMLLHYYGVAIPLNYQRSSYWSKAYTIWLEESDFSIGHAKMVLNELLLTVRFLRQRLLEVNRELRAMARSGKFSAQLILLQSVPGIGLIASVTILSELETIARFGNLDKLCAYVGLIPTTHSTGEHERHGKITPRSNNYLRSMLVESAWVAIRHDPALLASYQKLTQRMEPNRAIIRIAKKLLSRIKHVLKTNEEYVFSLVE